MEFLYRKYMAGVVRAGILAVLLFMTSCVNFNRVEVSSFHIDSITPSGFRSVSATASAMVSNRSAEFSVYDIYGVVRSKGHVFGDFSIEPFTVKARTDGKYSVNGSLSLGQNVSMMDILSIARDLDINDFTVDISLKIKPKGGAVRRVEMKDLPAGRVIELMKRRSI